MPEMSADGCLDTTATKFTGHGGQKSESPAYADAGWMLLVAVLYFTCTLLILWHADAVAAAFGTYPDEPSHYIGGLLARDYAASGMSQGPSAFAVAYHDRLPYFAIGYWPPLFYCLEGAAVFLFGPSRFVVLLVGAMCAAGSAWLIFCVVRDEAGWLPAFCGGLLFLAVPEVQKQICTTMVDLPVTVGVLCATLFASRYLAAGRMRDSIGFSLCAAAACLTKYSAAYVCLVPVMGIIYLRRWRLLRSATFWLQPAIVITLIAPWALFAAHYTFIGLPERSGAPLMRIAMFLSAMLRTVPWPIWLLVVPGTVAGIYAPSRQTAIPLSFSVHLAALLAYLTVSSVSNEPRYLLPGIAALLIASLYNWRWLGERLPRHVASAVLLASTAIALGLGIQSPPHLRANNVGSVVEKVLAQSRWQESSILVAGDAEGPMIAEFAMRDPHRPEYRLVRPDKVLASDDWFGRNYKSLCENPGDAQAILTDMNVRLVIIRRYADRNERKHESMLREAVAQRPDLWRQVDKGPPDTGEYALFEAVDSRSDSRGQLQNPMNRLLARAARNGASVFASAYRAATAGSGPSSEYCNSLSSPPF